MLHKAAQGEMCAAWGWFFEWMALALAAAAVAVMVRHMIFVSLQTH